MSPMIIGIIIVGIIVLGGGIAFFVIRRRSSDDLDSRLESIENYDDFSDFMEGYEDEEGESEREATSSVLDSARGIFNSTVNESVSNQKWGKAMRQKLSRADLKITVAEFAASRFAGAVIGFVVGYAFLAGGDFIFSTLFGVIGYFTPGFLVNRRVTQRLRAFETQLADTLGLWVNALRSGYSVLQSMEAISKDAPEPTATEFARVVKEVALGIDMKDALDHLLERIESEDLDLVVTAVNIQREVGGNLAEILEVISGVIRERIKLKGEIRVLTSQGRMTGYVISFLPIALAVFLNFASPGYMNAMFTNRMCGWPMIGLALALIGMGTAVIQKIIDIEI